MECTFKPLKIFDIKQDLMGQNKPVNFGLHVNNQKITTFYVFLSTCHNMLLKITDLQIKKNT